MNDGVEDPFLIDRHDLDALKELVLSKFEEVERSADERAKQVEKALDAARAAADRAVTEAKMAADLVSQTLTKRLEQLESGGAPFASRLDDSIKELKRDVDTLKDNMVRTTALEELRKANTTAIESQRKSIKYIILASGLSFAFSTILLLIRFFAGG